MPDQTLVLRKGEELAPTAQPSVLAPFWVAAPWSVAQDLSAPAAVVTLIRSTFLACFASLGDGHEAGPVALGGGGGGGRLLLGPCAGKVGVGESP